MGKGTTFRVRIPAMVEPSVADANEPGGMDRSLRVLVVDDEPVSRSVLEGYLTRDGHKVVTATSAKEAIGCGETEEFDVLITDHAMPDMNGTQLAAIFREKRETEAADECGEHGEG